MEYEIKPCGEQESAYIEERFRAESSLAIHEDAEVAQRVFKVTDETGSILGGCVLEVDLCKIAEFNSLWVAEGHRRRGIATALILAAEEAARESGCTVIVNNFCFDFNHAGPLFEGLGYLRCGVTEGWPKGHEAYYYQKRLDTHPANALFPPIGTDYEVQLGSQEDGERIAQALEAYNTELP